MAPKRKAPPEGKAGHTSKKPATVDIETDDSASIAESAFASRYLSTPIPKDKFPSKELPANVAYQLITDARQLDCNPRLNLASFVTTWMEPEAEKLIANSLNVNQVDVEQYPATADLGQRCVAMLANLFHAEAQGLDSVGTACVGSSEAILLAGLAMKKRWQARRKAEGKEASKPNLVMGYNVQHVIASCSAAMPDTEQMAVRSMYPFEVCWEKFTRYFDVEENFVHLEKGVYVTDPVKAIAQADENTIGIVGILGSTYTGEYEDIKKMDEELTKLNDKTGWGLGIHVDGASGGFVAPFIDQDLKWDFELKNVHSINASGHKYGLVYPGIGWVIWRGKEYLPESMVFHTKYLGSDQPSFTLNFSKPAAPIIAQYYQFLRLGFSGYKKIMTNLRAVALRLESQLLESGHFTILSQHQGVPLVAFAINEVADKDGKSHKRRYNEFDLADRLKSRGWVLPAYRMAPDAQEVSLLRATIREDMSMSMVDELMKDILRAVGHLDHHFTFSDTQMSALSQRFHVKDVDWEDTDKHQVGVC